MTTFLLRRFALVLPTLFFVSVLIFGLQQLLPGDPALALAGEDRNPEVIAFLRQKYHFDEPPVLDLVLEKLPVTGELAAIAFLIALSIGVPIGVLSAVKNGSLIDYVATMAALWGLSIPNFGWGFC